MSKQSASEGLKQRYQALWQHLNGQGVSLGDRVAKELSDSQSLQLLAFVDFLGRWTTKVDLVSPAPAELLVERHIVDSLAAGLLLSAEVGLGPEQAYLDIGSGAGLPGVVLAVLEPARPLILTEPREKRVVFLKEVRRELGLENVRIESCRMEELTAEVFPGVGLLISRALGQESTFLQCARDILSPSGYAVQMLGPSWKPDPREPDTGSSRLKLLGAIDYSLADSGPSRKLGIWKCFT